jgi:hypothetical protein
MRQILLAGCVFFCAIASAGAQLAVGVSTPGISIGINVPSYPYLAPIPGYPVYYAPRLGANYFFYDGMYWVYEGDNWYTSAWYNGPWAIVAPEVVPVFILRVPVRYYYHRPSYFYGWRADAPPHWGEHWGAAWAQQRSGWDRWNRASAPRPAPLPVYQRQYAGNRYPQVAEQQALQSRNYRYQPRDAVVRQHFTAQRSQETPMPAQRSAERPPAAPAQSAPRVQSAAPTPRVAQQTHNPPAAVPRAPRPAPEERNSVRHDARVPNQTTSSLAPARAASPQRASPPPREAREAAQHVASNAPRPTVVPHQAQPPQAQREAPRAPEPRKGQERGRDRDEAHGGDHNK